MSYRIQIDVYGDKDKNRQQTELDERKNDRWIKRIMVAFLALMFLYYSRELFAQTMMDGSKVKIKNQGDTTEYVLESRTIRVTGMKDQAAEAVITLPDQYFPMDKYILRFSNPEDWEHSEVTMTDNYGAEVYRKQYEGYHPSMAKPTDGNGIFFYKNKYETLVALAFREGTKAKVNLWYYALVCLLYVFEFISFKLWEWIFFRYKIAWAVDRGTIPSHEYKVALRITRFVAFLLILYYSAMSYIR